MKNSTDNGFDQHYNVQVAVDQDSRLIVGNTLSNHANDKEEAIPTVDAIPAEVGKPKAAALDNGYWSPTNVEDCRRGASSPTSPQGVTATIKAGKNALPSSRNLLQKMPV